MWSTHKPPGSRGSTVPSNPTISRKWIRQSIKKPETEDLPTSSTSPVRGLRNIQGVPHQGLALDNLRSLNHGHKNLRFEHNQSTPIYSKPEKIPDSKLKDVRFPVPEHWHKKSFTSSKTKKTSFADSPENQKLFSDIEQKASEETPEQPEVKIPEDQLRSREGFMTEDQGIGTARGSSPIHKAELATSLSCSIKKKKYEEEDAEWKDDDEVPSNGIPAFMLLKTVTMKTSPIRGDKELQRKTSTIGVRLKQRAKALRLWKDEGSAVDTGEGPAVEIYNENHIRSAVAAHQVSSDLELGNPITSFIRVPVSPVLRLPERVRAEDQKSNLLKGGHGIENTLADLHMRAESLRRTRDPAKYKEEAKACLAMGIIYDNRMEFPKAREQYERFLELCTLLEEPEGEAVAYNFLGCNIQESQDLKLACQRDQIVLISGSSVVSTEAAIEYEKAASFHLKHADLADVEGKFIAYTNLGLLHATLGKWSEAAKSHKKALKCATFLDSPQEQCIAVGNLGFLLFRRKKTLAAKACLTRYLQICRLLGDIQGQARAHYTLGNIASQLKKYEEAEKEFRSAIKAAKVYGDKQIETFSKVQIGIVKGNQEFSKRKASFEVYNPDISMFMPTDAV
ncbi:hypothetical protein R1flu_009385 [Riccia fluitans]|uniref:Uncharacterized protein n=1 Tax=Riccia fluitans TaxID=41844 RepID=A0ABD1Z237_9MARC